MQIRGSTLVVNKLLRFLRSFMNKTGRLRILIIGPSAGYISGSLLRPLNIWYSLKDLSKASVKYAPISSVVHILLYVRDIGKADIIIISGINPWVATAAAILGKAFRRTVIVDFHGFSWYEAYFDYHQAFYMKLILLISEYLTYRLADHVITASTWLANTLREYFKVRKNVQVIPNSTTLLFEKLVHRLRRYDLQLLRKLSCRRLSLAKSCKDINILLAPLPKVFTSNLVAFEWLIRLSKPFLKKSLIIVTGIDAHEVSVENVVVVGYLPYTLYVVLLLAADAVILPYPSNAICGGARNKVLEAGYCGKAVISTRTGMLFTDALPGVHYVYLLDEGVENKLSNEEYLTRIGANLQELIKQRYTYRAFKEKLLRFIVYEVLK
ncbi:MAG: glycosyltransferase [Infirmifilum sp.]